MAIPKLALIPSSQGSKLYSVLPSNGVGDFAFTRGTSATRINSRGLIETVASGVSRLNYPLIDGVVNGCPSHLLEPTRLQKIQYSEDFSQGSWAKPAAIITSNSIISPDGSLNASLLKGDGVGSFPRIQTNVSGGGQIAFSIFVKKQLSDTVTIYLSGTGIGGGSETSSVYQYTFSTDSFLIISGGGVNSSESKSFGNDWVRLTLTYTTTTVTDLRIYPKYASTSTDGVYIFGAQLEEGSYPTSYIPNYGTVAGVTRSAETANGSGDASTFNSEQGVLMVEISALVNGDVDRVISLNDGNNLNNSVIINYHSLSGFIFFQVYKASVRILNFSVSNVYKSIFHKIAFKYKNSDYSVWIDGIEVLINALADNIPANTLNKLNFDIGGGQSDFYGNTKQIQYFDTALNDTDLETLTSWTSFTDLANGQTYSIK